MLDKDLPLDNNVLTDEEDDDYVEENLRDDHRSDASTLIDAINLLERNMVSVQPSTSKIIKQLSLQPKQTDIGKIIQRGVSSCYNFAKGPIEEDFSNWHVYLHWIIKTSI